MMDIRAIPIFALVLMAFAASLLLSRRTRRVGLGLLGLLVAGFFLLRVGVHVQRQPATNLAPFDVASQQALAESQAEIIKNQRLAAQMVDAFVQYAPDGSTLETYPDGMQVRQEPFGAREIIRESDPGHSFYTSYSANHSFESRTQFAWGVLVLPMLLLLGFFFAFRSKREGDASRRGSGLAWIGVGAAALLLGGYFTTTSWVEHSTMPPPVVGGSPTIVAEGSFPANESVATSMGGAAPEVLAKLESESIEALWARLTAPKIKLEQLAAAPRTSSQEEVIAAAKVILSATAPSADPFTQGWLTNAAKAMLAVSKSKERPDALAHASNAPSVTPPSADVQQLAEAEVVAEAPLSSEAAGVQTVTAETADPAPEGAVALPTSQPATERPRPDWVDAPPKLVGNTRRFVVSTDPFVTVDECHVQLRQKIRELVEQRVALLAREANGGYAYVPRLESMGINIDYILAELCPEDDYIETMNLSFGPMKVAHALVEFNEPQDQRLLEHWRRYTRQERMVGVAGGASLAVAGLAFIFGLLKVDTWTRGYYTKRLFLGVPAAIIGLYLLAAVTLG